VADDMTDPEAKLIMLPHRRTPLRWCGMIPSSSQLGVIA
jgi:hypothetical protein